MSNQRIARKGARQLDVIELLRRAVQLDRFGTEILHLHRHPLSVGRVEQLRALGNVGAPHARRIVAFGAVLLTPSTTIESLPPARVALTVWSLPLSSVADEKATS